jgi:hypothetical protein
VTGPHPGSSGCGRAHPHRSAPNTVIPPATSASDGPDRVGVPGVKGTYRVTGQPRCHLSVDGMRLMPADRLADCGYQQVWVRWVRQQLTIAVAYELTAHDPRKGPHLRGLPLSVDPEYGDPVAFLRRLISVLAVTYRGLDFLARCDRVAAAVLRERGVHIAEPDLTVMVAWRPAQYRVLAPPAPDVAELFGEDHECFDPEGVAAELVESGLIAPSWKLTQMTARYTELLHARRANRPASPPARRRAAAGSAEQLALAFPA